VGKSERSGAESLRTGVMEGQSLGGGGWKKEGGAKKQTGRGLGRKMSHGVRGKKKVQKTNQGYI